MKYLYKISSIVATLALIAGLSFSTSYAQTTNKNTNNSEANTLSGKVINAQGQAVANAQVTVLSATNMVKTKNKNKTMTNRNNNSNSKTATTDKNGQFTIDNVSSGTYTVKVEADGYQASKQQVSITKDKTVTITLQPSQQ